MRRFVLVVGMFAAMAATAGTGAVAMEEQRGPAPGALAPDVPKAQAQDSAGSAKSDEGMEIRIPGLGKLGTLPKMDFGLELLYGADEDKPAHESQPDNNLEQQQDLMIHGSVKHRF